jgi:hypothetical protein
MPGSTRVELHGRRHRVRQLDFAQLLVRAHVARQSARDRLALVVGELEAGDPLRLLRPSPS